MFPKPWASFKEHGASDATRHYTGISGIVFFLPTKGVCQMTINCVSAKISIEMAQLIEKSGFLPSDVIQVGLETFFSLPREQQENLIANHVQQKKLQRALSKYTNRRGHV